MAMHMAKSEGFMGLYKGYSASALREAVYSSIRLGLYEPFKVALGGTDPSNTPLWIKFTAGSLWLSRINSRKPSWYVESQDAGMVRITSHFKRSCKVCI